MRVVFFTGVEPRLEALVVIECGFGRGLVRGIGAGGAGRICGSLRGRISQLDFRFDWHVESGGCAF